MVKSSFLASAAVAPVLIVLAVSAAASEVRCVRSDEAIRRIAIEVEDPNQGVPCEVVYWKDTEEPGVRSVLWSAQTDAAFCESKADELVGKLKSVGWVCEPIGEPTQAATRQPPPAVAEPSSSPSPGGSVGEATVAARPPATEPPATEPPATTAPAPTAEPPARTAPSTEARPAVREALAPQRPEIEPDPDMGLEPGDTPSATVLDAIIEQNLVRLNDGVDGRFGAEIASYGDLNGDGRDDGLVFFTYQSERLGEARFVAAYLYDGEGYTLAATKPLAGSDDNIHSAEVESVEDGVISVLLNVLEPGDASCCPSGTRRQTLVLRDGQLVEDRPAARVESRS